MNLIATLNPDYREVADEDGLEIDPDVRVKNVRGKNSEILVLGTERC